MKRFPCVLQDDASSCGVACLATIAQRYGDRPSWPQLREAAGTVLEGTNLAGLSHAAENMGFLSHAVSAVPEALPNLPVPFVAHVTREGAGHFVVVHEVKNNHVVVADPAQGLESCSRQQFLDRWSGNALLLTRQHGLPSAMEESGLFRRIVAMVVPHRRLLAEGLVAATLMTLLSYGTALLFSTMVDRVYPAGDIWTLHLFGVLAVVLAVVMGLFSVVNTLLLVTIGQRVSVHLLFPTLHRLLRLPLSYYDTRRLGDILHRYSSLLALKALVVRGPITVTLDGFVLLMVTSLLFFYHWKLAVAIIAVLPLMFLVTILTRIPIRRLHAEALKAGGKLNAQVVSMLGGMRTVKAFGAEDLMADRSDPLVGRMIRIGVRMQTLAMIPRVTNQVLAAIGIALIYWLGGSMVISGDLSLGQLIFCVTLAGSIFGPFLSLLETVLHVQESLATLERATDIVDAEVESAPENPVIPRREVRGEVCLENVSFHYGQEENSLRDVSFRIDPGEIVAIVGASGSGKSTLLKLIQRLYLAQEGRVLVDNINVCDWDPRSLRSYVSAVDQECRTFAGTVTENLAVAGAHITQDRIQAAVRLVGLGRVIEKLPARYDTDLGEGGMRLSGGERQRLALARAVARGPKVLLLDEATSHLDPSMERELFRRLQMGMKGTTILFATHRIALAQLCDRVLVFKKGCLVEQGKPDELMEKKGLYAEFHGRTHEAR